MHKIIYLLMVACMILLISSCEKDADVKLPAVDSKLVINSFISPQDTLITVTVTLSQPLFNNSNSQTYGGITNATVQISNGSTTKTLTYDSIQNYYYVSASILPIVAGGTYYLTVTTPDGKNISATTFIPNINSTLSFATHSISNPQQYENYFMEVHWNDSPGTEDYYRVVYYEKSINNTFPDTTYSYYLIFSENFSDKSGDGKTFNQNFQFNQYLGNGNTGELCLIHSSKEFYLYHKALKDSQNSGDNPFAEPVQMYSNINGGFGVFAGFNQYKLPVSL